MINKSLFYYQIFSFVLALLTSLIFLSVSSYAYAKEANESTSFNNNEDYYQYFKVEQNNAAPFEDSLDSKLLDNFFNGGYEESKNDVHLHGDENPKKIFDHNSAKASSLPFSPEVKFDKNHVDVNIAISGKSYIYRPSLTLVIDPEFISYQEPVLPKATTHSDALGDSFVYFKEVKFSIPIQKAKAGAIMILHYQGCDESGICYPPQSFMITIPYDIDLDKEVEPNQGYTQLDSSTHNKTNNQSTNILNEHQGQSLATDTNEQSVSYINQAHNEPIDEPKATNSLFSFFDVEGNSENSDAISLLLTENLLIGLAICFLLGIGLDLTPCVLPMLPIFSAMIIGSKTTTVKTNDVLEQTEELKANQGNNKVKEPSKARRMNFVFMQNLGFASGLVLTYTILGLLFSLAGAQLHGFLQSAALNFVLAILMIICALACADLFEIKMPSFITNRLQNRTSKLNTSKFSGAFVLGASAAIIASPCTSAPLAGALLYVMKNGDILIGTLVFFTIGLGMATPLFIIGMFGSKFLMKSGIVGDIIKRLMVVVLIGTAFIIVRHNLGRAEIFVGALTTYIICVYTLISILFFIRRRVITMVLATLVLIISLVPTYLSLDYFEQSLKEHNYNAFYPAQDLATLNSLSENNFSYVVFTAQWCANCKIMEKEIYSTEHFINSSMEFKKILVNITNTEDPNIQEIINKYQVIGVPFFMTLDDKGQVVQSRLGLVSTKHVHEALDKLRKLSNKEAHAHKK